MRNLRDHETHSEEELCALIQDGDMHALSILIDRCKDVIEMMARAVHKKENARFIHVEELQGEGPRGVYEAALAFDPDRGVSFRPLLKQVLKNHMLDLAKQTYRQKEDSMDRVNELWLLEEEGKIVIAGEHEHSSRAEHVLRDKVDVYVTNKIFCEQLRDCFLQLSDRQQQILTYKFNYHADRPPMSCEGRKYPDWQVALHFQTKTSLVQRSNQKAYKELKKGLFGEDSASKPEIKEKSEDGAFLKEFWKCNR